MGRIRSDSIWNGLAPERRRLFEHWLFEERVSYDEARARAKNMWGVTASKMSVSRYYRRRVEAEPANRFADLLEAEGTINGNTEKLGELKESVMKATTMRYLENAIHHGAIKDLTGLSRVLRQHQGGEIARGRLELARDRLRLDAAMGAGKEGVSGEPRAKKPLRVTRGNAL